ncbi:hypothetical protein A2Z00_00720 [Candidatus Gottesmanbacteria bacterium RBG_13_45_10]|uniref:Iron permease n=1 Tax=Candidatus Gottesmanbacteria bacterium RBG_13_45_10 TaxID=1798370 RepID=A0A1F5ZHW8_9BACT|nr:MAG: hypothetical protein A2Z00_00720 [Candidatus Gottesmanbacteria bacterium RBG_13_45_10]
MLPALLISLREVIEASLIVATMLGVLAKLGHTKSIRTVWLGTCSAILASLLILGLGSALGLKLQQLYSGKTEATIEGMLMMLSAIFVTWAVFFLHTYFAHNKVLLLQKIRPTLEKEEQNGIFILAFTAVFREGLEIVLFLSTIYLSSNPVQILSGVGLGLFVGVTLSFMLFSATIRLPVFHAFRITSGLLILFAAGLLARGLGELMEAGVVTVWKQLPDITFGFLPNDTSFLGHMIQTIFGITKSMHTTQLTVYLFYIIGMSWWVFFRKNYRKLA